mmetsp:Transcript_140/g.222  ORF Transcript_140/g.222 Transcript_140/m.222 type:complete len:196 (-) Transcript_140:42-629(-)
MGLSNDSKSRFLEDKNNNVSDKCPDGNVCYNGSKCLPLEKGYRSPVEGRTYRCDCSTNTTSSTEFFAGYGCEYDATDYCIDGPYAGASKSISFCTNGQCLENWFPHEGEQLYHVGCTCLEGWEGDFCEYLTGQAPHRYSGRNIGTVISFGIVMPTIILSIAGIVIWKKRKNAKIDNREQSAPPIGQLKVDHADII